MRFKHFIRHEHGAALIDWVVLMAALFGLTTGVFIAFGGSAEVVGDAVESTLDDMTVGDLPTTE